MAPVFETEAVFSVLDVTGALRAPLDHELRERVAALLDRGERRITLNVERLSDIDAAGLGELVSILKMTAAAGGVLRIAGARRPVRELLHATGLLALLDGLVERRDA